MSPKTAAPCASPLLDSKRSNGKLHGIKKSDGWPTRNRRHGVMVWADRIHSASNTAGRLPWLFRMWPDTTASIRASEHPRIHGPRCTLPLQWTKWTGGETKDRPLPACTARHGDPGLRTIRACSRAAPAYPYAPNRRAAEGSVIQPGMIRTAAWSREFVGTVWRERHPAFSHVYPQWRHLILWKALLARLPATSAPLHSQGNDARTKRRDREETDRHIETGRDHIRLRVLTQDTRAA